MTTTKVNALKAIKWFKSFLFVVPALTFYIIFMVIPIFGTIRISFHEWNGAAPKMTFVGLQNYIRVFSDPIFYKAIGHNLFWIIFTIVVPVLLGLILAILIMQSFVRMRILFRVTYFMPTLVSLVAVGVVWGWMYNPDFGIIGRVVDFFKVFGASNIDWLGNEKIVLWSLVVAGSWTYYGFCMVIFMAALQGIDACYIEVAVIEGANPWQKFIYVIVPLLKGTITLLVLNSLIGSFKVFDIIMIMTKGGPYHSSEVISTYMFSAAFSLNEYGYGAALAIVLAVIIGISSSIYMRFAEKD